MTKPEYYLTKEPYTDPVTNETNTLWVLRGGGRYSSVLDKEINDALPNTVYKFMERALDEWFEENGDE